MPNRLVLLLSILTLAFGLRAQAPEGGSAMPGDDEVVESVMNAPSSQAPGTAEPGVSGSESTDLGSAGTAGSGKTTGAPAHMENSVIWDGHSKKRPNGGGTQDNPYLIREPAELAWLMGTQTRDDDTPENFKGKYFRLMEDIDLGGHPWTPIRPSLSNKESDGVTAYSGFQGNIDGNGHTIKNLKILWNDALTNVGFGFITYLAEGSVKNLSFENAHLTRTENGRVLNSNDIKMGILAGAIGPNATVKNINLVNCRIDDWDPNTATPTNTDGTPKSIDGKPYTLYVGGVVGDVANGFGGADELKTNLPSITNVVSDVDIDLGNTTRTYNSGKLSQFNVGGVIGRIRRVNLPISNVIYSGSINAPVASVGPIYSVWRYNASNSLADFTRAYAAESATTTARYADGEQPSGMWFYDYRIYNHVDAAPGYKDITVDYPSGEGRLHGVRTFTADTSDTDFTSDNVNNRMLWSRFQGVNRGVSLDALTGDGEIYNLRNALASFNASGEGNGMRWIYDEALGGIRLLSVDASLISRQTDIFTFEAEVDHLPREISPTQLRYQWSIVMRKADLSWVDPIVVYNDENPDGDLKSEFTLTGDMHTMLSQLINEEIDLYDRFFVRIDVMVEDGTDGAGNPVYVPLESGGTPIFSMRSPMRPALRVQNPTTYIGEADFGQGIVDLGSHHLIPVVMVGNVDVTHSDRIRYEWSAQLPDGSWVTPQNPYSVDTTVDCYVYPSVFDRKVNFKLYSTETGYPLGEYEFDLKAAGLEIRDMRPESAEEQVYGVVMVSPYDGKVMAYNLKVDWMDPDPSVPYSVDAESMYMTIHHSELDPTLAAYTVRATYTQMGITREVSKKFNRLALQFVEGRDSSNEQCYTAALTLAYDDTKKFEGDVHGQWKWYVGSLLEADTSLHEITNPAAEGLRITYEYDSPTQGRWTRLYGFDSDHVYRVEWTSDPTWYYDIEGNAITLRRDKTQAITLYVYDKALTASAPAGATTFDGLDPDGVAYPDGNDGNDGKTPWTALKTLEEAYRRLPAYGSREESRIIVMGYISNNNIYRYRMTTNDVAYANLDNYAKPVTVCGKYYRVDRDGAVIPGNILTDYDGCIGVPNQGSFVELGIGAPHTFADITIWSDKKYSAIFYANRHDLTIDRGVTFKNFKQLATVKNLGLKDDESIKIPEITLVTGRHDYNKVDDKGKFVEDEYIRPLNDDPFLTTIIVRSACFARVIGAARNNNVNDKSGNVAGSPTKPFRSHVIIDIDEANSVNGNPYYIGKNYSHDIGLVTGGQTDGSVWGDISVEIRSGHISRYISGNISYGREIEGKPDDSFFGRSELSLYGGKVDELFGGSLGRYSDAKIADGYVINPYFYGISILNIYGGEIRNNIYGAGAGGVMGIGRKTNTPGLIDWSPDRFIPYYDTNNKLHYGPYEEAVTQSTTIPVINVRIRDAQGIEGEVDDRDNFSHIDLANSAVEVNIYGGKIYGNVYGGGYGHSTSLKASLTPYGTVQDDNGVNRNICVTGNLYGSSKVRVTGGQIFGNVYGGGAGSDLYVKDATKRPGVDYTKLALLFGDTDVEISGGIVGKTRADFGNDAEITDLTKTPLDFYDLVGNAYGGGQGLERHDDMAAVYGNSNMHITGGTVMGNVFAGGDFADIRRGPANRLYEASGNAFVTIDGGVLGNSIFGGSRGSVDENGENGKTARIAGDTYVTVNDGVFLGTPYINEVDRTHGYRNFNIYGGGYLNCIVDGTAYVKMNTSLMNDEESFMEKGENPNEWPDAVSDFQRAYMDITYRRFCVYGGGYGEKTRVLNTDVQLYISELLNKPHGITLAHPYYKQSLFDVAGGGYSGDVGYWADNSDRGFKPGDEGYERYDHYVGGECKVVVDGYAYTRKVIGGGFYGSCYSTDTHIKCGSLRQVYGGSLLGYVHGKARLTFGNRIEDFIDGFAGDWSRFSETQIADATRRAAAKNTLLYITENIYGGNDVKGIIGTARWLDPDGKPGIEANDGGPLFTADVTDDGSKGIVFNIFGGTFMGDVYGAGNGHYRGYYVPEWVRYDDGPKRMYSKAIASVDNPDGTKTGNVYRSRPMVGSVLINIQGNGEGDDRVRILGDFFGGGRACTIGQWNTLLPFEDPRRLIKGGYLHINFGSHVDVHGAVYMGADGNGFNTQVTIPKGIDLSTFNGSTTKELERLGEAAYGHWYYNTERKRYEPGYPEPGEVDGNYGMTGEHMLRGYLKNIEMPGDLELTFYDDPFEKTKEGLYRLDDQGNRVRRTWLPAELTIEKYDSKDVFFHDFFLGGRCGSMTNNVVMQYAYPTPEGQPDKHESYGAIYRASIPYGVSVARAVVMGSRDANTRIYPHNDDFTAFVTERTETQKDDEDHDVEVTVPVEPWYTYNGGLVTQSPLTYDIIVWNDREAQANPGHVRFIGLPDDFYTNAAYEGIRNADSYTMADGTTIYRKKYVREGHYFSNWSSTSGHQLSDGRYDLAVWRDGDKELAYAGERETRTAATAVKGAIRCNFTLERLPEVGPGVADPYHAPQMHGPALEHDVEVAHPELHLNEGGLLYGGCYNSGDTMGDVILIATGNMFCRHIVPDEYEHYSDFASLQYNIGRVYGGGYGRDTRIVGNTYINLLMNFRGFNVFGGGHGGTVTGNTTVNYIGTENSYVYGSIYGGGLYGPVGTDFCVYDEEGNLVDTAYPGDVDPATGRRKADAAMPEATDLEIISGNVNRVYGGACLADIYGNTKVNVLDEAVGALDHLDLDEYRGLGENVTSMRRARLIVGSVYGGNDITGTIHAFPRAEKDEFDTNVTVFEKEKSGDDARVLSPGSADNHNGFPLVGSLYGGSNGKYGTVVDGKYAEGTSVQVFIGQGTETAEQPWIDLDLSGVSVPNIESTNITVTGGTIVDAYCGGNNATVTGRARATVEYSTLNARAGFDNTNDSDDPKRIWNLFELSSQEQFDEVLLRQDDDDFVYKYQIYHFYSGNDNADMDIQPDVRLLTGHIGSAYGGGNNGRMTYWRLQDGVNHGIELTVDSPKIHIEELYGGGRIGDIQALADDGSTVHFGAHEYGATLNVHAGLIEAVYGGNDVCGTVYNGTNVNIYGAISGDVYGAGNGNYLYQLDTELDEDSRSVYEEYDDREYGGRYFRLPPKSEYGGKGATAAQRIMAINSYRPNVEKAYLNLHGSRIDDSSVVDPVTGLQTDNANRVWVKGNVYCGGNSSTIRPDMPVFGTETDNHNSIRFNIGDYVVLNGVFLGSNGESLADTRADGMMMRFEKLNRLELNKPNDLTEAQLPHYEKSAASLDHYPHLLSLYMRAVEVDGVPEEFNFAITRYESFIGNFCLGGNRGSMMTDKTIRVTLPEQLTVYGNIVGGCYDTTFEYQGVLHSGGMTQFLDTQTGASSGEQSSDIGQADPTLDENNKVWISVKSQFYPLRIQYPLDGDIFKIRLVPDIVSDGGVEHYGVNSCNIYGGCYNSGLTVGDIRIDLYSDMTEHADIDRILNGVDRQIRSFDVVGAGFGKMSYVVGDTKVRMLPGGKNRKGEAIHPHCAAIFGGSQEGQLLGNSFVSVRDGQVLTNVYGGSESAVMRGSSTVIIGYPRAYRCKKSGIYYLSRVDKYSETSYTGVVDARGNEVVKKTIKLLENDIVAPNVFDIVNAYSPDDGSETLVYFESNEEKTSGESPYFALAQATPETFHAKWDDIDISIGVNNMYNFGDPNKRFYGHGNVYGGGFVSNNSDVTLAGKPTVVKYDKDDVRINTRKELREGYGGNSMVLIADNPKNSLLDFDGEEGAALRDHISIGTANLKRVELKAGENKIGKYYIAPENEAKGLVGANRLFHQEAGKITAEDVAAGRNVFYEVEGDGGIYGGGRKVFVEGFRACDLSGYGYAEHTPNHPKHLGTVQRLDLFSIRDCCMQLTGAPDYASSKIDATPYSMTRIGGLRMISTLPADMKLDTGTEPALTGDNRIDKPGYPQHNQTRSRNYMGFFNQIHFVGALQSSTRFNHDTDNHWYHGDDGMNVEGTSYREKKEAMVANRMDSEDTNFPKRNVATAHNMIGINNGYTLKIQGTYFEGSEDNEVEKVYYGPVEGVVEVKLLTLVADEGGGYIYALNCHDGLGREEQSASADHFTEITGNFVYPGRLFGSGSESGAHYMLDDCFPMGYDYMEANGGWKKEPVHYWYVSGNSYYFNATLTAYTYNHPKDFFLNNYDELIMLSGLEEGKSNVTVKNVTWHNHPDTAYKCDLADYERTGNDAYRLYLSVDKNSDINFADLPEGSSMRDGAYVSRIPRSDYDDSMATSADGVNPNSTENGKFDHKETAGDNMPVVGIMLHDAMTSDEYMTPEYYQKHLADPHDVTLELEADTEGVITKYTINLRIIYLQGPNINGHIRIENCALPGEIVKANTGDMVVSLSEELVVEDRLWVAKAADGSAEVDVTSFRNEQDYSKLEMPVWYYQNDWDLVYRLVINGEKFDVTTDPASKHPNIEVHNYHRMKAMYGETEITQVLTPGCIVYIEDDADMQKFIEFADAVSRDDHEPGDLPGTSLKDRPTDCEGLTFILAGDRVLPERDPNTFTVPARFGGSLYGNGYHIYATDTTPLFNVLTESGTIRDIGFIAGAGKGYVINEMEPKTGEEEYGFVNCYFLASDANGGFNRTVKPTDTFRNCGQNCNPGRTSTYHDTDEFIYGRAAYNVNGYYLKGRYEKLVAGDMQADAMVHTLDDFYYSGDYRFANVDPYGNGTPTALRTKARPNYLNRERTGMTNHNMDHLVDQPRHVEAVTDAGGNIVEPEHYRPLWPDDYIMFGQKLTASESTSDPYPMHYDGTNRVYRASGFYGSKQDRGFHFNVDAVAKQPTLTAIDFGGHCDSDQPYSLGRTITDRRDIFCSPMIDLPDAGADTYGLNDLTIVSASAIDACDGVTRNLLVYVKTEGADALVGELKYDENVRQTAITGHVIVDTSTWSGNKQTEAKYEANGGIFHLVDLQDFNAPIAFTVADRAWYDRRPGSWSSGNNAWEGICLPFAANRVSAFGDPDADGASVLRDHGEISHFYGNDGVAYDTPNVYNRLHEYWLRSLVGMDKVGTEDKLVFARPGMEGRPFLDETKAVRPEVTADYHYSNTWLPNAYGSEYVNTHNKYMAEGVDFLAYRFLTGDMPYIISFPSERYREFDLSGNFYMNNHQNEMSAYPMTIRYEYLTRANRARKESFEDTRVGDDAALPVLTIGISDDASRKVRADRGSEQWIFEGTFMRKTLDSASYGVLDGAGAGFVRCDVDQTVLPFRAFMSAPGAINTRFGIAAPSEDPIVTPDMDDDEYETDDMEFFVEHDVLVVRSPRDARIALCDIQGRVVRMLDIRPGRNEYRDLDQGVYLAGRFKFLIR